MFNEIGDPVHLEFHGNANAGAQVLIYKAGNDSAYTLAANEFIEIFDLQVISATGGDTFVAVDIIANIGTTPTAGTVVVRGTLAATSGIVMSHARYTGFNNAVPYVTSPGAITDVCGRGAIRQTTVPGRQPWQSHYQTATQGQTANVGPN